MQRVSAQALASATAAVAGLVALLVSVFFDGALLFTMNTVATSAVVTGLAALTAYLFYDGIPIELFVPGVAIGAAIWLVLSPFAFQVTTLAVVRPLLVYINVGCGVLAGLLLSYASYTGRDAGSLSALDQTVS